MEFETRDRIIARFAPDFKAFTYEFASKSHFRANRIWEKRTIEDDRTSASCPVASKSSPIHTISRFAQAITDMVVRGAPAIGAADGIRDLRSRDSNRILLKPARLVADLQAAASTLKAARPTAVNLAWAVDRRVGRPLPAGDRETPEVRGGG